MYKNYLLTAIRNLKRNKLFSLINLFGLALGVACSLLILLWVQSELNVDSFHANGDRLYKVYSREYYNDNIDGNYDTPGLLADELKNKIPEIEDAMTLQENNSESTLRVGDKMLLIEGTGAGASLFTMFSYPLIEGSPKLALSTPTNIAISRKTAAQFFDSPHDAMGKTIRMDNEKDYIVSAVFEDMNENVSRKFDYVISWQAWLEENSWARNWGSSGPLTFIMLRKDANPAAVSKQLVHFLDAYNKDQSDAYRIEMGMQKFDEAYLHSNFRNGEVAGGRIEYVKLFSLVAMFILLIACINFMNLSTANSLKRAREIGVRKASGATRAMLVRQFLGEALFMTVMAVLLSLALVSMLLPAFNLVTEKQMLIPWSSTAFWLRLLAITAVTGLIAGSYPALFLSSFNPVKVLKGTVKFGMGAVWFRKGLVVFQFTLSLVLIIGTIVVSRQVRFIQSRNLGYDRENLIYISADGELNKAYKTLKQEALKLPGIQDMTRISDNPSNLDQQTNDVDWSGRDPKTLISFEHPEVGLDFVRTMKLSLMEGRDFSSDYGTDSNAVMLNQVAVQRIGYKDPLGKMITINGRRCVIVGILKDFHFRSLHEAITPMIINYGNWGGNMVIRTQPGKTREALASLEAVCKKFNPEFPFSYSFSDEEFRKLYQNEQVVSKLSNYFAFLGIFISCMGLLGLVMFTAEQRTREIGIRKVLGAGIGNIVQLMSADFIRLVLIAIAIATPVAWWAMTAWLNEYAYKTSIEWWMFALAGLCAVLIAVLTISFHAIKAAMNNPVKALRTE